MDPQDLQRLMEMARAVRDGGGEGPSMREGHLDQVLGAELLAEQAVSLGRAGRKLLTRIAVAKELASQLEGDGDLANRSALREKYSIAYKRAEEARWELLVQREAMGLRHHQNIDEVYPMPRSPEVHDRTLPT